MIERFIDDFKAQAQAMIVRLEHNMGLGLCGSFESYRFHVGQIKAWREAMQCADELRVKLGEDVDT